MAGASARARHPFMIAGNPAGGGKRKRSTEEDDLQKLCANYLRTVLPPPPAGPFWFHTPNGGSRAKGEGAKFKEMGVKAGFPDLAFLRALPALSFCIELKAKKGVLTKDQKEVIPALLTLGIRTYVCRSLEDLMCVLEAENVATNDALARQLVASRDPAKPVSPPSWPRAGAVG
ncbi:VRR-NUC domain-containing protein [Nisaea sp.]|uniref:VRR-NUC domain-containing protein n=1 Tax=Nisaea sp. TaxID=2024842 RepID=UPI003296CB18